MKNEDLRDVVEAATFAPSVYNTQPWRFFVRGDAVDVFADRTRALPVIDPAGRELHISCGAALACACVAVRGKEREYTVTLLPDPSDTDHLARIDIGGGEPSTAEDRSLARALAVRHTHREPFDERRVPDWTVEDLRRAADSEGVWVRVVADPEELVTTAVLLSHADQLQRTDPAYLRELAAWTSTGSGAPDGIPPAAIPATPPAERGSSLRLRDFDAATAGADVPPTLGPPPPAEHPLVLILGTDGDDPRSWLQAGQALGRLLLRAAVEGIAASPITQVLEVPTFRVRLTRELGLLGYPQMMLRLGYGHSHPVTPRRAVADVLTEAP
jgi:nitroreductase